MDDAMRPKSRPTVTITFEFSLFGEDRDAAYAEAMADAIFDHLAEGPTDLDEWDYSVDGWTVDEYRPAQDNT